MRVDQHYDLIPLLFHMQLLSCLRHKQNTLIVCIYTISENVMPFCCPGKSLLNILYRTDVFPEDISIQKSIEVGLKSQASYIRGNVFPYGCLCVHLSIYVVNVFLLFLYFFDIAHFQSAKWSFLVEIRQKV